MSKTKDTTDNAASCAASTFPFAAAIEWPEVKENRRLPVKLTVPVPVAAKVMGLELVQQKIMPRLFVPPVPKPVSEMLPLLVLSVLVALPPDPQ